MIHCESAPAKINLFLDVLRKRADGYHDIGTLFQTIAAGDTLRAEADSSGEIRLSYDKTQEYPVQSDLVYKAARLLQETYRVSAGARLYLQKSLPLGAGLGGGSADAAAALRLLNRVWGLGASAAELTSLGVRLGADVPFLVAGGSALATGIGEVLEPLPFICLPEDAALLVVTPLCAVPTVAAYAGIRPSGSARWDAFAEACRSTAKAIAPFAEDFDLFNKFEESVLPAYPQIAELRSQLTKKGAARVLMSGSGASVFGLFESRLRAEKAYKEVGTLIRWGCVSRFYFPNIDTQSAKAL